MNLHKDFPEFLVTFIIMYFLNQEILKKKKNPTFRIELHHVYIGPVQMCQYGLSKLTHKQQNKN